MLFAYYVSNSMYRIRGFLECLKNNKNVPRKSLKCVAEYITMLADVSGDYDKSKIYLTMGEYMFRKVPAVKTGSSA